MFHPEISYIYTHNIYIYTHTIYLVHKVTHKLFLDIRTGRSLEDFIQSTIVVITSRAKICVLGQTDRRLGGRGRAFQ